jgi:hypothetical protein
MTGPSSWPIEEIGSLYHVPRSLDIPLYFQQFFIYSQRNFGYTGLYPWHIKSLYFCIIPKTLNNCKPESITLRCCVSNMGLTFGQARSDPNSTRLARREQGSGGGNSFVMYPGWPQCPASDDLRKRHL